MRTSILLVLILSTGCSAIGGNRNAPTDEPIVEAQFAHFMADEAIKLIARIDSKQVTVYRMSENAPPLQSLLEDKLRIKGFSVSRSEGNTVECALVQLGEQRYLLTLGIGQERATRLFKTQDNYMVPESGWSFQGVSRYE